MAINISIKNSNFRGNSRILNNATINSANSVDVQLDNVDTSDGTRILEGLNIVDVISELEKRKYSLDNNSEEYRDINRILLNKRLTRNDMLSLFAQHLGNFSQGILASIIANHITK